MTRARSVPVVALLVLSVVAGPAVATVAAEAADGQYQPGDLLGAETAEDTYFGDSPYYLEKDPKCTHDGSLVDVQHLVYKYTHKCHIVRDASVTDQTTANFVGDDIQTDTKAGINEAHNRTDGDLMDDALAEAQEAYAKALANDFSKVEAQAAAADAATEYIGQQMVNDLVTQNENLVTRLAGIRESPGVNLSIDYAEEITANRTLFPNTNASTDVTFSLIKTSGDYHLSLLTAKDSYSNNALSAPGGRTTSFPVSITYDQSEYSDKSISPDVDKFVSTWESYENVRPAVVSEIQNFSDSLNQSEFENLEPSDIIDRRQAASEWAEKYNDTGSNGYAAALLAENGYTIPGNVSTTYMVNLTSTDSVDYTGTLFGAPGAWSSTNNTIQTGTVYDGANQTAWVLTLNGTQEDLTESYTVESIELKDGTQVNQTQMRAPSDGYFANVSAFRASLERYQTLMNQTQDLEGGSGLGFFGGGSSPMILLLLGIIGGGFLVMRLGGSGGSGGSGRVRGRSDANVDSRGRRSYDDAPDGW